MPAAEVLVDEADYPYEEDVLNNPYAIRSWWRYLEFKQDAGAKQRFMLFERGLVGMPASYKLWYNYLVERLHRAKRYRPGSKKVENLNNTFERSLIYLHKMPKIWEEYLKFLLKQAKFTHTRRVFDRALRSLPITQHERIWKLYVPFVKRTKVPETIIRVYRRAMKLEPARIEEYVEYLTSIGRMEEAARCLGKMVNDDKFVSMKGKSKHQLWLQLCDIMSKHPDAVQDMKVEAIIRGGIARFSDEVGRLWTSLANYYIRLAQFEKARDIFEEGLDTVMTVRDFSQIWDGYTLFVDSLVTARMKAAELEAADSDSDSDDEEEEEEESLDLLMARYENLLERRPMLLSSVLLRQNPHNVHEWQKRVNLSEDPKHVVDNYTQALQIVDPHKSTGKVHTLWVNFAKFYEQHDEMDSARAIFDQAVEARFKYVQDLATVWCEYAEMELRQKNFHRARDVLERATTPPRGARRHQTGRDTPLQSRVYKEVRLWGFYADLEESLGTFESTRAVYERVLDLRIATPQVILNYAQFLASNGYFEDSFKAYERGVNMFDYPFALDIWITYLTSFIRRYKGTKLERARDLFEEAVDGVPAEDAKTLYVMYANLEEEYGLARHAMSVYDRATRAVALEDQFPMYLLYISRATEFFGVTRTREIFEQAIGRLQPKDVKRICVKYADLEKKLGEIDRARSIYIHTSQFCDPRLERRFWHLWHEFEVEHGNEDTYREMLRVKRSVGAQYGTANIMSSDIARKRSGIDSAPDDVVHKQYENDMQRLEREAARLAGHKEKVEVLPANGAAGGGGGGIGAEADPEEIDLDMDDDDDDADAGGSGGGGGVEIEMLSVPKRVFGSVDESEESEMGAKERLKRRKIG
eukprot:TRINITY_DN162_c0_g1_i1.p1 TRINITY_DN162_c0_g1~~TRINITY_DN162_c0_g1_i1.p1  ORF type:complete len:867 (-),score=301.55 TRINITY_DN162_c0_g1_i1:137-2737(-)